MPTYAIFGGLAVLTMVLAMRDNMRGLATLLTPAFVLFVGWLCVTILLSFDPSTSIRRFSLTACVIAVAAALPLLAKSQHEILRWLSIAALVLLATCYLGILLAPHLSIHLATDPQEPGLGRKLARLVRPQERRGGHHGDAAVLWHRFHPRGQLDLRGRGDRPVVAVSVLCRRQEFAGALLCRC